MQPMLLTYPLFWMKCFSYYLCNFLISFPCLLWECFDSRLVVLEPFFFVADCLQVLFLVLLYQLSLIHIHFSQRLSVAFACSIILVDALFKLFEDSCFFFLLNLIFYWVFVNVLLVAEVAPHPPVLLHFAEPSVQFGRYLIQLLQSLFNLMYAPLVLFPHHFSLRSHRTFILLLHVCKIS